MQQNGGGLITYTGYSITKIHPLQTTGGKLFNMQYGRKTVMRLNGEDWRLNFISILWEKTNLA